MPAYQYFWRNGHFIGRVRAGAMGFDSKKGHDHWHFEQFARYTLLNKAKSVAVTSHKAGFCIAPSDEVDLLLPYETSTRNDVSLRKVILGGTPGSRTVKVPAWKGIDPEP